jgi:non-ribosomal peptide synthetase component F
MHELLEQTVASLGDRADEALALVHEDCSMTYAEMNARCNRLARYLRAECGVGRA